MVSSSILTYEQAIRIFVEGLLFFIFYAIYLRITQSSFFFGDLLITSVFFFLWILSVSLVSNLVLALQSNVSRSVNL